MQASIHTPGAVEAATRPVHRGRVELIPEPPSASPIPRDNRARLRQNLGDAACRMLFAGACFAQIADAVTTAIGLGRAGRFEANALMRYAVTAPLTVGLLKLALVTLVSALALLRLPTRRARVGLLLAMSLGLIAPIQNIFQILASR